MSPKKSVNIDCISMNFLKKCKNELRVVLANLLGGGHFDTFTGPMLFFGYRPHLLIYFDEMLYGSLY